jgi:uncharacterized membrane protein YhaH (DUF805 family)
MKHYFNALKKYATFRGRARRKEYWMFVLFYFLFLVAIGLLELGIKFLDLGFSTIIPYGNGGQGVLNLAFLIAMILPNIAVGVRRMHDVGKSGWFLLIPFYNIILLFTNGEKGENKYGENPKGE